MNTKALIVPPPQATTSSVETNDIRALKGPVAVPADYERYLWMAAILAALAAALIWRRVLRRLVQRLVGGRGITLPPIPPHVRARHRLAAALAHISDPKLFCSEVSDTIRFYLEERFEFHAPERTTEEFLIELQESRLLNEEQKESLAAFLQSCDLAKFARFEPTESALRELHDSALRLVDETQFTPVLQPQETVTA